jgi:hypothetical protein
MLRLFTRGSGSRGPTVAGHIRESRSAFFASNSSGGQEPGQPDGTHRHDSEFGNVPRPACSLSGQMRVCNGTLSASWKRLVVA